MKVTVMFKTPDAVAHTLSDAVEMEMLRERMNVMDDGWDGEFKRRYDREESKIAQFVKFGENVWIEFDTDTGEARVQKQ